MNLGLSGDRRIAHTEENVIIVEEKGTLNDAIVAYSFSPTQLPCDLQAKFGGIKGLNIKAQVFDGFDDTYHQIPNWLASLNEIQSLALWDADLSGFSMFREFRMVYLDLRRVKYADSATLIDTICTLKQLEIFICDDSIPDDIISTLRERLPKVQFVKKGK